MTYYENLEMMRRDYPDIWDYYRIHRKQQVSEYFEDPCRFIQNTFMHAQKERLIPGRLNEELIARPGISEARAAHSISALMLGAMLARCFCGGRFLTFKTEYGQKDEESYSFAYVWTLTSLYHDCGYSMEKSDALKQEFERKRKNSNDVYGLTQKGQKATVGCILNRLSIEKTPWRERNRCWTYRKEHIQQRETDRLRHKLFLRYSERPTCIYVGNHEQPIALFNRSEEDIIQYAIFRLTPSQGRQACVDHGIFGGYRLFDSMLKNYVDVYKIQKEIDETTCFNHFSYDDKIFRIDQFTLFAYIADCIMNHNIWRQKPGTEDGEICKSLGLYYALGTNYEKIHLLKNPLLFILAFADSLEPYKLFCENGIDSHEYNQNELLEIFNQVGVQVCGNSITIRAPEEKRKRLLNSLESMGEWLAIRCYSEEGTVSISPIIEN